MPDNNRYGSPATSQIKEQAHAVKNDLGELKEDLGAMGHLTKEAAVETVDHARDAAGELVDAGKEKAIDYEVTLREQVKTHPMRSVAIAAGAGLLFGLLSRR